MPSTIITVRVAEVAPKHDDNWKRLCAAVVYRRDLKLSQGTGQMMGMGAMGGFVHIERPAGMTDELEAALKEELSAEFSRVIETDRRNTAILALDEVERLDKELRAASSLTKQAMDAVSAAKTADEVAELVQKWGPRLLTTWSVLRAAIGQ